MQVMTSEETGPSALPMQELDSANILKELRSMFSPRASVGVQSYGHLDVGLAKL